MDRIRVVLADDHPIVLAGIRTLLDADPKVELVGEATNGGEALPLIRTLAPRPCSTAPSRSGATSTAGRASVSARGFRMPSPARARARRR